MQRQAEAGGVSWDEHELKLWKDEVMEAAEDSQTAEEADFYNLWEDDLDNSPPTVEVAIRLGI